MVYETIDSKVALISDPMFPGNAVIDILRETGIGIEQISDAEDIFFKLKRGNIGVILIDIVTINPSIVDLVERLQDYVQEMPVIVMSAESTYRQLKKFLKFKEFYYLNKPYQNDEFLILVRRLLSTWALRSASTRMRERFQMREAELDIYAQAGSILASCSTVEEKLISLFSRIGKVIPSESWNLVFIEPDTGELVFRIIAGKVSKPPHLRFSPEQGILGWVASHGVPEIVENARKDKRYDPSIEKITRIKARTMLCFPLRYAGRLVGILQLINRSADTSYTESDVEIITPFADYAAIATANEQLQQQNEQMSVKDHLTGLYNTKFLDAAMDREIQRSSRYDMPFSFMMIDIDNYYALCQQLGREVAIEVVVEMSNLLQVEVRSVDVLARYTADRFAALLPNLAAADGVAMARRLMKKVEEHTFLTKQGPGEKLTICIGLACYPKDADSKDELMTLAHQALASAQKESNNRVITADAVALPATGEPADERPKRKKTAKAKAKK